jgi:hypothetical protein
MSKSNKLPDIDFDEVPPAELARFASRILDHLAYGHNLDISIWRKGHEKRKCKGDYPRNVIVGPHDNNLIPTIAEGRYLTIQIEVPTWDIKKLHG